MKKYIRIIMILFFAGVFVFSCYQLYKNWLVYRINEMLYENIASECVEQIEGEVPLAVDFEKLKQKNADCIGWIYCQDTPINYPVVQGEDNDYYLYRMFDGSKNKTGSIYFDYRNSQDVTDLNTIVYGHSIHSGKMFTCVQDYDEQEYYEEHPVMWYFTEDKTYRLDVIMSFTVDKWESIVYRIPTQREELIDYLLSMEEKSYFESSVDINSIEKIMTLSTCSFDVEYGRDVLLLNVVEIEK